MGEGSAPDGARPLSPVLELAHQQLTPQLQLRCDGFLTRYFQHLSLTDLKAREPRDLLGAALAHLRLGEQRAPGEAKVQVFNPDLVASGWQSPHTVVQVVTDDMPFLVDSVRMVMTAMGLGIHLVIHPMLRVVREGDRYVGLEEGTADEAWIHLEVDRCDGARQEALRQRLLTTLDDVRVAVADWRSMRDRCRSARPRARAHACSPLGTGESSRAAQFLRWLSDDHLVFLGYREYDFTPAPATGSDEVIAAVPGTGLGLLRDGRRTEDPHRMTELTPEARRMVFSPVRAHADHGQQPQHDLAGRLPGLHRRQAVRPRRPGCGRAPLPRALQLRRLPRQRARHPSAAGEGRRGARSGRVRAGEPQRPGAAPDPGDLPAQRALPDRRRRAVHHHVAGSSSCRTGARCGSSSGGTTTAASSPAWCTCPGTATRRTGRSRSPRRCARCTAGRAPSTTCSSAWARWPGCTCGWRSGPRSASRSSPRWRSASAPSWPTGRTSSGPRSSASSARTRAWPLWPASPTPSRPTTATPIRPPSPPPT